MPLRLFLNLSIEFGPIIVFLVASSLTSFIPATLIFVMATFVALVAGFLERKKLAWFPFIVGMTIIVSGLLTFFLNNPFFLIIKDTLYNGIFALVLLTGLLFKKPLLKPLFGNLFVMTEKGWSILTLRWAVMFIILAVSNEVVRMFLPPEEWIVYKGIATLVTILFSLYQFRLSKKERLPEASPWGMKK